MAEKDLPPDIKKMSFEAALEELERIVRELETGRADLEAAIKAYERGIALKTHCEAKLHEAELKVEKIVAGAGGGARTEPADAD